MKKRIKLPFLIAAAILCAQFTVNSLQVFALKDELFYSTNNITFFDPDANDCSTAGKTSSSTAANINIEKSTTIDTIYNYLTKTNISTNSNKPLSAAQAAGVMGNMYAESSFNPSAIESTTRADKGHGLVQWTFGRWNNLSAFASQKGTDWDDLNTQLEFLKTEFEGAEKALFDDSEFANAQEPAVAAMRFRIIFERADPTLAHDDKREGAAISVFKLYGGSSSADCTTGNGVVAGNLVKTAMNFAVQQPVAEGVNKESDANPTYQEAKPQYNPSVHWTDCGGFIATVMFATGVDPNYPKVSVTAQTNYVRAHPEKYLINENPTLNDLQPGDILFTSGHTTMYTGADQYPSVDASFHNPSTGAGGRVPSLRNSGNTTWMIGEGAISARVIK